MAQNSIIIFHRISYSKVLYNELINHEEYDVHYLILNSDDIPDNVRCKKIYLEHHKIIVDTVHLVYSQKINIYQIVALSEYDLLEASILRNIFNINMAHSVVDTIAHRDKLVMKNMIVNNSIRTAEYVSLSKLEKGFSNEWKKIILKPTNGAASNNIKLFNSESNFKYNHIKNPYSYMVEEYISGDILHFDGLVHNGNVLFSIASTYINNCLEFATKSTPLASYQQENNNNIGWVIQCINALNILNGPFHIEAILNKNGLYFLEAANRAGGANVVKCTEYTTGVNLMQEQVKMQLYWDDYKHPDVLISDKVYGWFVIPHNSFNYNSDINNVKAITGNLLDLHKISINETELNSGISYDEKHNPCTGIIFADSEQEFKNIINILFKEIVTKY